MLARTPSAEGVDGNWHQHVQENGMNASDTVRVAFSCRIAETALVSTRANVSVDGTYFFIKKEFLTAADHPAIGGRSDASMTAADSASALVYSGAPTGILDAAVAEFLTLEDIDIDPENFTSIGVNFWGYKAWLDAGFTTLAVYCAGLDLGDWPILSQGQVFVPWLADADKLFTPGYLVNTSTAYSGDVPGFYGATACNIDLHDNDGNIIRVVVDLAIGMPYTSRLQLLRPDTPDLSHNQDGPSIATTRRLHMWGVKLVQSQGIMAGTTDATLRPVVFKNARGDKYPQNRLFTGIYWNQADADYNFDNMMLVEVKRPWPATIAALVGFLKTFGRE